MACQRSLLLCLLVAGAFGTCVAPAGITMNFETWVPETPYVGEASYMVVNGTNHQTSSFTWTHCQINLYQGTYSYGSQGYIPCWTDEVKSGANFRFQTGVVWVPQDAPLGSYTWELMTYDDNGNQGGCWSGSVDVEEDPNPHADDDVACTNTGGFTLGVETWVPAAPVQGFASFAVLNGQNKRNTSLQISNVQVTYVRVKDGYTWTSPIVITNCPVTAAGASLRCQTGSIWIPSAMKTGKYTAYITAMDVNKNPLGCITSTVTIKKAPSDTEAEEKEDTCCPGIFTGHTETWVPAKPQRGNATYVVVQGTNTASYTANAYNCTVTMTQGSYSYGSNGRIACWTGPVASGADFRVQTAAVQVPAKAPLGQYTTEIQAFSLTGQAVGCWHGVATVVNPPPSDE